MSGPTLARDSKATLLEERNERRHVRVDAEGARAGARARRDRVWCEGGPRSRTPPQCFGEAVVLSDECGW